MYLEEDTLPGVSFGVSADLVTDGPVAARAAIQTCQLLVANLQAVTATGCRASLLTRHIGMAELSGPTTAGWSVNTTSPGQMSRAATMYRPTKSLFPATIALHYH